MKVTLPWPLFCLTDERGYNAGYACVQGPTRTAAESHLLSTLASTMQLVGMTSYLTFPSEHTSGDTFNYEQACVAWCHCFRNPDAFLPPGTPRLVLSHSDFTDYALVSPHSFSLEESYKKRYDFVYVCQSGAWSEQVKNWELARRCLPTLCFNLGLTGILVGRRHIADLPDYEDRLTICDKLPWEDLMRIILQSRFLFVPNELDASPRVIAESLCLNTPVLVNRNILGGWKYVNPFTGSFFESEHDVAAGARMCLERWTSPRRWFVANYGPVLAGRRLAHFLGNVDPALRHIAQLHISYTLELPGINPELAS